MPYKWHVVRHLLGKFVIAYIEYILIYSPYLYSNVNHLLYVKHEKCTFHVPIISYLEYVFSPKGVAKYEVTAVSIWMVHSYDY